MSRSLRVAFFVGAFPMTSETFVVNAAKKVLDAGHDLDIYAVDPQFRQTSEVQDTVARYDMVERTRSPHVPNGAGKLAGLAKAFGKTYAREGSKAFRLLTTPCPDGLRTKARTIFDASALREGASYDVIHVHFGQLSHRVLQLRRAGLLKGKVLVHFRGGDISSYVMAQGEDVYDATFRDADHFCANSEFFRQKAIKLGAPADRSDVLPSGLDTSKFTFAARTMPTEGPVRLISVGRLVEKKGFVDVIDALPKISTDKPLRYTIIGDGPLRDELEARARAVGFGDRVEFLGAQSLDRIAQELQNAHIFLGPSVTASDGNQDGPINTLKEAMASGLPVVGTRHGGIPELLEHGRSGFIVPERNPTALAAAVTELLASPERWPAMGKAGAEKVKNDYDLESTGEKMLSIYRSMLAEGARV
ncbi:glycosyltransferase [Parvularcula lutaonensis]|uniref:Glycosyltransferase n=1 Tax=Parvularcula lutaonensis TaxID=491923 RepID=A0ABV7MCU1_9PROT|nr:glycosyltransferase [Parvularcula lutaonensis]GGY37996.1 colanic acid biosynthesis glycosyltransferase WcaL [Parvularcula lutaonensis]